MSLPSGSAAAITAASPGALYTVGSAHVHARQPHVGQSTVPLGSRFAFGPHHWEHSGGAQGPAPCRWFRKKKMGLSSARGRSGQRSKDGMVWE